MAQLPFRQNLEVNRSTKAIKYAQNLAILLCAFILSSVLLSSIIPSPKAPPKVPIISDKFNYFLEHKDQFDAIFIGSSRTHSGISPEIFEKAIEENGYKLKTFNFGISGMRILPTYFLLKKVVAAKPANLKYVFIENRLDSGFVYVGSMRTNDAIYWQTPNNTVFSIQYILGSDESFARKLAAIYTNLVPCFYNIINLGALPNRFASNINIQGGTGEADQPLGPRNDGYIVNSSDPQNKKHLEFLKQSDLYQKQLNALKDPKAKGEKLTPNKIQLLSHFVQEVEAAGAKPIFIIAPGMSKQADLLQAYAEDYIPALFAFNNPIQFPEFYQPENRIDIEHLNGDTAKAFSRVLGQAFVNYLKETGEE